MLEAPLFHAGYDLFRQFVPFSVKVAVHYSSPGLLPPYTAGPRPVAVTVPQA